MTAATSTRPYLIRAIHEWCSDNGLTPYISVRVDRHTQVPLEYVKDDEIILNTSFDASSGLQMANDYISFKSRFNGVIRDILIPVKNVQSIFAKENGQGMSFPMPPAEEQIAESEKQVKIPEAGRSVDVPKKAPSSKPFLKIVK